jgi:putative hemolysin
MIAAFKTMTRASNYDLAEKHLPPLFQFYLGAGAQVAPEPAVDTKLNCYDFMTVLALNEINQRHAKKYRASHL